jgi:hypothetical protein
MSSVATNTSTLWPDIQQGLARLHQIVEEEGENSSNYSEINKENIPVSYGTKLSFYFISHAKLL